MASNYNLTRDQIITAALRKLGVIEPGDTSAIDPNIQANAAVSLETMVKQWGTDGIKLWTVAEYVLPLTANKTSYTIGPTVGNDLVTDKPLQLIQAWIRNTVSTPNIDIPVQIISRQEYNILGSKFSNGTANSVFFDPGVTSSTVRVYLTPDTVAANTYDLYLVVRTPIDDFTTGTANPNFPNEWLNALVWGLADELAIEFDVPANHRQEIAMRAARYKEQLNSWDVEYTSIYFQPDYRNYVKSYR